MHGNPSSSRAPRARDVDGIVALARLNEAEAGGTLTGKRTPEAVAAAIARLPNIVAKRDGRVVGFLLTADKAAPDLPPVVRAMLAAYSGGADAYIYGPICVDASVRGGGVMAAMVDEVKRLLPGREGILFIRRDKPRRCAPMPSSACARSPASSMTAPTSRCSLIDENVDALAIASRQRARFARHALPAGFARYFFKLAGEAGGEREGARASAREG